MLRHYSYRIHASIISYIEKHEYSVGTEELLQMFLDRAADSPFMKAKLVRDGESRKKKLAEKALYPVCINYCFELNL